MRRIVRSLFVIAALLIGGVAQAQRAAVSGTVRDSLSGLPLRGAFVQLVTDSVNAMPRTVVTDSAGRYRIDTVPAGRYIISFLHPLLDSLTLEPILHSLVVAGDRDITYNLATPAGPRLRSVFCGSGQGGALVGVVRDAVSGEPLPGVSVVADWMDLVITRGAMGHQPASRAVTSNANGWFALCGVPGPGNLTMQAGHLGDSTDRIDLAIPASLFARRDLYIGSSRTGVTLRGRIVNEKGKGLSGAIASVARGPRTRSDANGEWTLTGVPSGTRILDLRAIGYFPERRPVDVVRAPAVIHVQMATFESVLDTIRVSAAMTRGADEGGFEQRRRSSGSGRFVTQQDIERRSPIETSEIFNAVPGMHPGFEMRSSFSGPVGSGSLPRCTPNVFIDGRPMPQPGSAGGSPIDELNSWIRVSEISSIEIYPDVPPPQFQVALNGCGSVVFWTKRRVPVRKPPE